MSWFTKIYNALHPARLDDDLANEMHDHLERRAADFETRGLTPADARRAAERAFGSGVRHRESSRDAKMAVELETAYQDARYACRGLLRNPVFALTSIISLGVAIGANTALYSIVDAAILRPLAVPQPEHLVALALSDASEGFSYPAYEVLRDAAAGAGRVALVDSPNRVEAEVGNAGAREDVVRQLVSFDLFEVLGVPPAVGRLFDRTQDRSAAPVPVAVLSHAYWKRRFHGDGSVIGKTLVVDGKSCTILGVAREGFSGVEPGRPVDVWLPIAITDPGVFTSPDFRPFHLIARLSGGETQDQFGARLEAAWRNYRRSQVSPGVAVGARSSRELAMVVSSGATGISAFRQTYSKPLWLLLGVAACILLVACANVASLLSARSTARGGELALRIALGAGRLRLVRSQLTESAIIAVIATLVGWLVARAAAPAVLAMVSKQADPIQLDLSLDARVMIFCVALCSLSALCFGLLPAWDATRTQPMSELHRLRGAGGRVGLGRFFVGVQVAFAFCLVTGGIGFVFSWRNLTSVDTGFDPRGLTVLHITDALGPRERDRQLAAMQELRMRSAALAPSRGVATAWMPIFGGGRRAQRVIVPGHTLSADAETFYRVSPGFLSTLRIPLLGGRDLDARDNDNEPVPTIVNRAFSQKYFGRESAIGLKFQRDDSVHHLIVGMAADSHYGDLHGGPEPVAYMPMKPTNSFTLYVRANLDAGAVATLVGREAQAIGGGMRVRDVTTLETLVGNTILRERLLASIGAVFALIGLLLVAIGLFGLLNYAVTRRTKELGIRAALGAHRWSLCAMVLRDLARTMVGGLVVGLAAFAVLMRFAASLLFGVRPADPLVIGTATAVFLAVAVIAAGIPARRAALMDPLLALRND
jgi:putative ABC transport system permease protein